MTDHKRQLYTILIQHEAYTKRIEKLQNQLLYARMFLSIAIAVAAGCVFALVSITQQP